MDEYQLIGLVILIVLFMAYLFRHVKLSRVFTTKFLTHTAIFGAVSAILYIIPIFNISLPIFPSFLKVHVEEIPIFITGFIYGPWSVIISLLIKTIIKLPFSTTACVGELADLLYSIVFVIPAVMIYQKKKTFKRAVIGFAISTIFQIIFASLFTSFVMIDFYINVMGWSKDAILKMCQEINPNINDLGWTFCIVFELPFNAIKDILVAVITIIIYKKIHYLIEKV